MEVGSANVLKHVEVLGNVRDRKAHQNVSAQLEPGHQANQYNKILDPITVVRIFDTVMAMN